MLRLVIYLSLWAGFTQLDAAELSIVGKWMVEEFSSTTQSTDGKPLGQSKAHCRPGNVTIEIGVGTMTTSLALSPGKPVKVIAMTFTIQQQTDDSLTMLLVTPQNQNGIPTRITREGTALIMTDAKTSSKLIPYDETAVAAEMKRIADSERPADALRDAPLSGRLAGADWTPTFCRRSWFQADEKDTIRVNVTVEESSRFKPSAQPSLLVALPMKPGTYPLSNTFTITVVTPPSRNTVISNGTLVIYTVSATTITFGLTARGVDGLVVNGTMTADVSPLNDQ